MLKVMSDRVLVKILLPSDKTKSGIQLPKEEKPLIVKGVVLDVGDGEFQNGMPVPMLYKKGEKVLFEKHCAVYIEYEGADYAILKQIDILAKEKSE